VAHHSDQGWRYGLRVLRRASLLAVLAALAVGCGAVEPTRDFSPAGGIGGLPDIKVTDLTTGEKESLLQLPSGRRALLVWFWAPESAASEREAGRLERFARARHAAVEVIGIGAREDREAAEEFVAEFGLGTPTMVYDGSRETWEALGVAEHPAAILFDRAGREVRRWHGPLDEQDVAAAAYAVR
jgi:hypothetical protein